MAETLQVALKLSLVTFMVGNLLDMGLRLTIRDAVVGLKNFRFVFWSLLWGFALCPALALLLTKIIPLSHPYAIGLVLLGMAPCAPFLPMMVETAKGDLGYAAAFMLLASVVTVAYMPLAVPIMVQGLSASAWTIAKPLLLFLLVPLLIGMTINKVAGPVANKLHPVVKKTTGLATILMLILCVVVYAKGFEAAVGTYAIGSQIVFFAVGTVASYCLSFGLPKKQKTVVSLGMATRNLGAAFAPLFALHGVDNRAIVMVAIGVPMQTFFSFATAKWFERHAEPPNAKAAQSGAGA